MTRAPDVLVAPNCLRGFASATEVAEAIAVGVRRARPSARIRLLPLADGGDGTIDVVTAAAPTGTQRRYSTAPDALGRPRQVPWLLLAPQTALVESASICGLAALRGDQLRPMLANSVGVGQVLSDAVGDGVTTVLLGLGGTAVVDGGAGALAALGARFLDIRGAEVIPAPATMASVEGIDLAPARRRLAGVRLRLLADVRAAASANVGTFGAQKGVTDRDRPLVTAALLRLVHLLTEAGDGEARDRFDQEWCGAGGAIGFGLGAVAPVAAGSGVAELLDRLGSGRDVGSAGLVLTAEGAVDDTTWLGKLPGEIAALRRARGLPTGVIGVRFSGALCSSPPELVSMHPVAGDDLAPDVVVEGAQLRDGLARAAEAACLTWSDHRSAVRS